MFNLKSFSLFTVFCGALCCNAAEPYHLSREIPVDGEGGWDCLRIDGSGHRLYVSHSSKFVVIDTEKNAIVGEISGTPGAHDIAIAPELGRGFTSNGKENKSSVVDLATLKTLGKIDTGKNPDIVVYEPSQKEVWCFNAKGNSITVINAASASVVATIALPGNPEFAACDSSAGKVYCNIESKNEVGVIDIKTHTLETTWPIAPGEAASGLAIDLVHHRLFLGCDNQLLVVMDSTNGKVITSLPIGRHIDGTVFDPGTQLAFASGGDGTTTIIHEDTPDQFTVVQKLQTELGAKTMTLDAPTHRIYLGSAKFEALPPGSQENRPKMIPGTFKVLVYEIAK
ncbi:MAG: YncE family protein [Verrucomicrobia bacterium]|nr:YncE family protein [Verrucomicrobiota bacterium]